MQRFVMLSSVILLSSALLLTITSRLSLCLFIYFFDSVIYIIDSEGRLFKFYFNFIKKLLLLKFIRTTFFFLLTVEEKRGEID